MDTINNLGNNYQFLIQKDIDLLKTNKTTEMKKLLIFASIATLFLGSCRENKTETKEVIREVHVEKTEAPSEGALERAAKKVDEKVNDKIDETIDEID